MSFFVMIKNPEGKINAMTIGVAGKPYLLETAVFPSYESAREYAIGFLSLVSGYSFEVFRQGGGYAD